MCKGGTIQLRIGYLKRVPREFQVATKLNCFEKMISLNTCWCFLLLDNQGRFDLELMEVHSGTYFGENEIVRFEDR